MHGRIGFGFGFGLGYEAGLCMVHACMHGIPQYHTWNTPVPCMEYACIMHGMRLYHAWNMPLSYIKH